MEIKNKIYFSFPMSTSVRKHTGIMLMGNFLIRCHSGVTSQCPIFKYFMFMHSSFINIFIRDKGDIRIVILHIYFRMPISERHWYIQYPIQSQGQKFPPKRQIPWGDGIPCCPWDRMGYVCRMLLMYAGSIYN